MSTWSRRSSCTGKGDATAAGQEGDAALAPALQVDFTTSKEGTGVWQSPAQFSSLQEADIQPCWGEVTSEKLRRVVASSLAGGFMKLP